MSEEWREVAGTNGWYEVSNEGRVRSWMPKGTSRQRRTEPLVLRPAPNTNGYLFVGIYVPKPRCARLHRLVIGAFGPAQPTPEHQCGHGDGNKLNNHIDNLSWVTASENQLAKREHGTMIRGEQINNAKLTEAEVVEMRRLFARGGVTSKWLGEQFGVTHSTANNVVRRKTWMHVG